MASFIGPNSVFTGPIKNEEPVNNEELANNGDDDNGDNSMDAAPTDEPQPEQLDRIFKYHISTNGTGPGSSIGMVIFNTKPGTLPYYENLYRIHSLIDEKHDNTDGKRVSEYLKNKVYKNNVIDAINYSTVGRVSSFSTGVTVSTLRNYSVNNTVTTLHDALERLGDSFIIGINGNQYTAPTLPSLQILPWNCSRNIIQDELANNMVVYRGFDTINGCTNEIAGNRVKLEMGIQSTGYVHDVGPTGLFNRITANVGADGEPRNIVSGKLDSSPVGGEFTYPDERQIENLQTLIPFMDIYNEAGELIGIIMIYIAPRLRDDDDDYDVFLAFKFFLITTGNYAPIYTIDEIPTILGQTRTQNIASIQGTGWFTYLVEDAVPNLPEIAQYMSGANGCFPAILKKMFGLSRNIYNKCEPYEAIGIRLFGTIGDTSIFGTRQDLFIMAFLMKIKWIGDLSRLIDSFMITEVHNLPTATATVDGFMKRFACLSNLYVYCANKNGGDLTINDVKTLTLQQIAILDERRELQLQQQLQQQLRASNDAMQDKIYKIITKMKWYKDLITQLNQFDNNNLIPRQVNWIPRQVILILNGILGEGAVEMEKLRFSSRIISTVVSCLGKQTFMYEKVKFTYTEMQSILDYFLTLFYYHIVFDYFKSSPYQNVGNIFDFVLTQSSAMSIGITNRQDNVDIEYFFTSQYHKSDIDISIINNGNPGGFISYYENIFNDIDNTMNILEKYNNISKIIPQYTGVNSRHRTLFDDSLYLLSKNIAEINTAKPVVQQLMLQPVVQQLMLQTITISQIPELSYEPNVGNTIRRHFGIFIDNQRIFPQQGGMPTPPMNANTTAKNRIRIPKNPILNKNMNVNPKPIMPPPKIKNVKKKVNRLKISFAPNKTKKKRNKNTISQEYENENYDTNNIINQSEDESLLFEGYSHDENIAIEQLKLETGYKEVLPMHERYYSHRIENINSYRQGILNDLHMLNENFTDGNNDQQINETSQYSDSETNFIFDLLYQTINYPYGEKKIKYNIINIKPTSYQYTTRFFGDNFTIFYKLAFDQIKADINFLEPNNEDKIDKIVTRFGNYTKYLKEYRDLKEDINTINSVYTDIYIEEYIEQTYSNGTIHNFDNGRQSFDTNGFYTNGFYTILIPCYRILTPPTLIPPELYNNNIPPSVFNLPGGSSKKNRRTKKKTSKTNKKNTRKVHPKKHRKTKRKSKK